MAALKAFTILPNGPLSASTFACKRIEVFSWSLQMRDSKAMGFNFALFFDNSNNQIPVLAKCNVAFTK